MLLKKSGPWSSLATSSRCSELSGNNCDASFLLKALLLLHPSCMQLLLSGRLVGDEQGTGSGQ